MEKMSNIRHLLSSNLLKKRKALGLTQSEVAEKAQISVGYYQDIEKAMTSWPQPKILEAMAKALGVKPEDLFVNPETIKKNAPPSLEAMTELVNKVFALEKKLKITEEQFKSQSDQFANMKDLLQTKNYENGLKIKQLTDINEQLTKALEKYGEGPFDEIEDIEA